MWTFQKVPRSGCRQSANRVYSHTAAYWHYHRRLRAEYNSDPPPIRIRDKRAKTGANGTLDRSTPLALKGDLPARAAW